MMNVFIKILRAPQRKAGFHIFPKPLLQLQLGSSITKTHSIGTVMEVNYEDIKTSTFHKDKLIIDVREPNELAETGIIPGSVNIPLGNVESVLKNMPENEFFQKYGRSKPSSQFPMIFSCRSGKRSLQALEIARQLGYKNVFNYAGGWLDWEEKLKQL